MTWTIRPARNDEAAAIESLWTDCGLVVPGNNPAADFRLALGKPGSDILTADEDGRIVGSVMVGHDGHRGWLYYLSTAPDRRGRGIARALIARAESWLIERRIPKIHLLVRESNLGVVPIYQAQGFALHPVRMMQKVLIPFPSPHESE
jgi:ribosomal protein S18 acetylase RimI-like enzyme